jgi:hypothetical protein
MRSRVLPAFEGYTLREITVSKVDRFIKTLAMTKSNSTAKQARTVLRLAFGLAVRQIARDFGGSEVFGDSERQQLTIGDNRR